ncbi:4408_t:CDS:1, partial [Gigaspora margarita]
RLINRSLLELNLRIAVTFNTKTVLNQQYTIDGSDEKKTYKRY